VTIDRREFVASGLVGLGVASVGNVAHAGNGASAARAANTATLTETFAPTTTPESLTANQQAAAESVEPVDPRNAGFAELLAPVAAGASLANATVVRVEVDSWGRGTAELRTEQGGLFNVDVCTKDASLNHTAVATTTRYDLFVRNGGDGSRATEEQVAHSVAALADAIRQNETSAPVVVLTKSEYWARGC
jgi:hypothetical protein